MNAFIVSENLKNQEIQQTSFWKGCNSFLSAVQTWIHTLKQKTWMMVLFLVQSFLSDLCNLVITSSLQTEAEERFLNREASQCSVMTDSAMLLFTDRIHKNVSLQFGCTCLTFSLHFYKFSKLNRNWNKTSSLSELFSGSSCLNQRTMCLFSTRNPPN